MSQVQSVQQRASDIFEQHASEAVNHGFAGEFAYWVSALGADPVIDDNQYEILLNLGAKAVAGETPLFLVDLTYAGLVSPKGVTEDDINPLIMIEGPRLLFPFARALISNATRDGGFMPLNIQPVDFVAVYQHNLEGQ